MKKLEFTFYCSNPKEKCPKTFCIIDGHACLFLKAQWETKFKESKRPTLANNAAPFHSLAAAEPKTAPGKDSHGKQTKPKPSEKPSNYNEEKRRNMRGWKK